jgi:hypothetical protein
MRAYIKINNVDENKEALKVAKCTCKLFPDRVRLEKTGSGKYDYRILYIH